MRSFITGITGQDGSYLAELLIQKGHEVAGLVRRTSTYSRPRIESIESSLKLYDGDMCDEFSIRRALKDFNGESWTVSQFAESVFTEFGLNFKDYLEFDKSLLRPNEVAHLKGNAFKASRDLGWNPKVKGEELVKVMVEAER